MSVHVSAYVWEHSIHKGAELLLMLAIADIAHKNGVAFPSVKTLSGFIRMSERQTQRLISRCEASGELEVKRNGGPHGTHLFRVRMNLTLPLFTPGSAKEGGDILSPDNLSGDKSTHRGVTNPPTRGDIAKSPEPKEQKKNRIAGGATPSPVASCFAAYAEGIKTRYGAEYPPSGKANGQFANIVGRVGGDAALAVTRFYVASSDPWYCKVRHSMDYLQRDCERLWLEVQIATGSAVKPPTKATAALLAADGTVKRPLGDRPLAGPVEVAKLVLSEYAGMIARIGAKYIEVRLGAERKVFTIEELTRETAHA